MSINIENIEIFKESFQSLDKKNPIVQKINSIALENAKNYSKAMLLLHELADYERGITWRINEKDNLIVRNACNASNPNGNYADYAIQMLNIASAAFDLLDIYVNNNQGPTTTFLKHVEQIKNKVSKISKNFLEEFLNTKTDTSSKHTKKLISMNTQIVDAIKEIFPKHSRKKVNKILGQASNYTVFHNTHYNISTMYNVEGSIFVQLSEKIVKKTIKQHEEYKNRKDKDWYRILDVEEQQLIEHHIDAILDDEHMLPIQAPNLIGIRNAYKTSLFQKKADSDKFSLLTHYIRSASPVILNKSKTAPSLQLLNKEQLLEVLNEKDILNVVSLNSDVKVIDKLIPSARTEHKIVKETHKLFDIPRDKRVKLRVKFFNIPTNFLRIFSTTNFQAAVNENANIMAADIFDEINKNTKSSDLPDNHKQLNTIKNFLKLKNSTKSSKLYKKSLHILSKIEITEDQKSLLKQLVELKNTLNSTIGLINNIKILFTHKNYNIKLVAQLQNLIVQYNKHFTEDAKQVTALSCKSGKDRTSSVTTTITFEAIKHSNPQLGEEKILKGVINSSGDQLLSSINAGTPGRFGTKPVSKAKFKSNYIKNIQQPTSNFTDIIPILKKKNVQQSMRFLTQKLVKQNKGEKGKVELIGYKKINEGSMQIQQDKQMKNKGEKGKVELIGYKKINEGSMPIQQDKQMEDMPKNLTLNYKLKSTNTAIDAVSSRTGWEKQNHR